MRAFFILFSVSLYYNPSKLSFLNTFFSTDLHKVLILKSINKRPRIISARSCALDGHGYRRSSPSLSIHIPISHP